MPSQDRANTSAADIPLNDLESASSSEFRSSGAKRWNGFSQFHPSNILAHPEGLAPMSQEDWLAYSEDTWQRLIVALTPSFLQQGSASSQPTKLHAIAALDGLRGWACLLVFNFHFLFTYTWKVAIGWGFAGENFGIHQLPILHMLISGHIMVAIFFVLSGYVLSYKPLKTIRSRSFDQTFTALASGTFRRAFRLYIPAIAGILCVFVAVRLGLYSYSHKVIKEGHTILGTNEQHPHVYRSLSKQSDDLWVTLATLLNPFDYALYYNYYNPHLWTIPLEFRSSLILFVVIMGTSRLKSPVRMAVVSGLIWFCMRYGRWEIPLFLFGMLMAEVDLINGVWEPSTRPPVEDDKTTIHFSPSKTTIRISRRKLWISLFFVGLYFGSCPNIGFKWTPLYRWLWHITPYTYPEPHRFAQTIGAVLIVFAINHSPDIQKLFTNPLSQYLGKISFAFYVVHGPILHCLGYSIMPSIWNLTGKETNFQYCLGFLIGWLICLPVAIWLGDVFWRAVDIPSVKFARALEDRLVSKIPPSSPILASRAD
ncbi:Acyltransferase 3 [Penicillium bovifimosum]|uniref:Acyltransferase 3 n=1 Tax=Penicillium bovifimosum TaxID=126998 RepID=A0A9W9L8E6_9EURO|nr:Acyltransferase 3 [Penicillium bovifimosum]KAJ5142818.1 Acyltransferase 3 [Penicillium bovifimosum]